MRAEPAAAARALLAWLAHPALVALGMLASLASAARLGPTLAVLLPVLGGVLAAVALERWMPYRRDWRAPRPQVLQDLLHNLVSTLGTSAVARALAFATLPPAAIWLQQQVGAELWPARWPLPAQLALALTIKELPYYATHRWLHASALGWRLHELHHASEQLYSMSSGRTHPVNVFLTYGLPQVPLILLGAPALVFTQVAVFMGIHGVLQHSNVAFRYGWLSAVFATAEVHRHHHSRRLEESGQNIGHNLMLWDHVFGTWCAPRTRGLEVGVEGAATPPSFWGQLVAPFTPGHDGRDATTSSPGRISRPAP